MIVLDTSALIAVFMPEDDAERYARAITDADRVLIGAPTVFEYLLVAFGRKGEAGLPDARRLIAHSKIEQVAWSGELAEAAFRAHRRFGKGVHPAKLNFGDCMAYALAKVHETPLLFKGGDLAQTDVRSAL